MTIGSAAFLPGPVPATPLPFSRAFSNAGLSGAAPPGRSPVGLSANDRPGGRILVVEHQAIVALDLQRTLRDAGYRVIGPASTVAEAERLIERGSIDCAILDLDLDRASTSAVADLLALSGVPVVFLLGSSREGLPECHRERPVVEEPYAKAELLMAVRRAMSAGADEDGIWYPVAPPINSWPRVMPQL
jgi:CheY-like chemotaxis protein